MAEREPGAAEHYKVSERGRRMTKETRRRKWRWLRHTAWVLGIKVTLIVIGVIVFFGSGAGNPFLKRVLIRRLNAATGGYTTVDSISIRWLSLKATIKSITIHGKEPTSTDPLFSAEEVEASLQVDSFWGRKVSLNDLKVTKPHVHIRAKKNGSTTGPCPAGQKKRSRKQLTKTH